MRSLILSTRNFLREEDGPTAVEYAVMLALIIVAAFTAIYSLGMTTSSTFNQPKISEALSST
jgi:pilus assembly protein Flp/PilA